MRRWLAALIAWALAGGCASSHRYVVVWTAPQVATGRITMICEVDSAGNLRHCL